jgi:hypothetical protein
LWLLRSLLLLLLQPPLVAVWAAAAAAAAAALGIPSLRQLLRRHISLNRHAALPLRLIRRLLLSFRCRLSSGRLPIRMWERQRQPLCTAAAQARRRQRAVASLQQAPLLQPLQRLRSHTS